MSQHLDPPRLNQRIQVAGLIVVIVAGLALVGVIIWATVTGRTISANRAAESARLQFELTRAQTCAITGALAMGPDERTQERVQMVVNDCLSQVELPFVTIDVPEDDQ